MVDFFDQINKQLSESEQRWKEIERIYEKLNNSTDDSKILEFTSQLIMLLVEHLRPMNSAKEQTTELQKKISEMLNTLAGGKK